MAPSTQPVATTTVAASETTLAAESNEINNKSKIKNGSDNIKYANNDISDTTPKLEPSRSSSESVPSLLLSEGVMSPVEEGVDTNTSTTTNYPLNGNLKASDADEDDVVCGHSKNEPRSEEWMNEFHPDWEISNANTNNDAAATKYSNSKFDNPNQAITHNEAPFQQQRQQQQQQQQQQSLQECLQHDNNSDSDIPRSRTISENSVGSFRFRVGTLIDPFPSPTNTPRTSVSGFPAPPFFEDCAVAAPATGGGGSVDQSVGVNKDMLDLVFAPSLESTEDDTKNKEKDGGGQNHNRQMHGTSSSTTSSMMRQCHTKPSSSLLHTCTEGQEGHCTPLEDPFDPLDDNNDNSNYDNENGTPPFTPYSPYLPQQTPLSSHRSSSTQGTSNKSWRDPFPTPDTSVHDQSSTFRDNEEDHSHGDYDYYNDENVRPLDLTHRLHRQNQQQHQHHQKALISPPPLPLKEELDGKSPSSIAGDYSSSSTLNPPPRFIGGFRIRQKMNHSSDAVDAMSVEAVVNFNELKVRRICSETSLLLPLEGDGGGRSSVSASRRGSGLPLRKRPSIEDFWKAFGSGPDGNDLELDEKERNVGNIGNDKKKRVRSSNRVENKKESFGRRQSSSDRLRTSLTLEDVGEEYHQRVNIDSLRKDANLRSTGRVLKYSTTDMKDNDSQWQGLRKRPVKRSSMPLSHETSSSHAPEPMTPTRQTIHSWTPFRSPVGQVRNSAEELVFSPVRNLIATNSERAVKMVHQNSERAVKLVRNTQRRLEERGKLRRQRRLARIKEPPPSWWIVIPADHPYKIAWDVLTMLWALMGAYRTHTRIRDRVFDQSPLILLTEIWFSLDILLNFVTEHKTSKGEVIRDGKTVWARYLTTWFVIDLLSLMPWERIYVRPVVEKIKKRNIFQKTFFRSKAVVRVSRVLRGRHIKLFGRVSKQTGTPLARLVNLAIKYIPKYLLFYRNMRGALMVRSMRFVHWFHNLYKGFWVKARRTMSSRGSGWRSELAILREQYDHDDEEDEDDEDHEEDEEEDEESDGDDESSYDDQARLPYRRGVSDGNEIDFPTPTKKSLSPAFPASSSRQRAFSEY